MSTAIATPPIQGLRALTYPPKQGEHYLSINLIKVDDVVNVFALATTLGFRPELVQITTRRGSTEIHALLLHECLNGAPLPPSPDLDTKIDQIAEAINPEAIRHCYGGRFLV